MFRRPGITTIGDTVTLYEERSLIKAQDKSSLNAMVEVILNAFIKQILERNLRKMIVNHPLGILFAARIIERLPDNASLISLTLQESNSDSNDDYSVLLISALKKYAKITSLTVQESKKPLTKFITDLANELNRGSLSLQKLRLYLSDSCCAADNPAFENLESALKKYSTLTSLKLIYDRKDIPEVNRKKIEAINSLLEARQSSNQKKHCAFFYFLASAKFENYFGVMAQSGVDAKEDQSRKHDFTQGDDKDLSIKRKKTS